MPDTKRRIEIRKKTMRYKMFIAIRKDHRTLPYMAATWYGKSKGQLRRVLILTGEDPREYDILKIEKTVIQ